VVLYVPSADGLELPLVEHGDSLMEIIHACGFDLPLTLVPVDRSADEELREALLATPSERVEWLLQVLGPTRGRASR
jgi:hypothetical protein